MFPVEACHDTLMKAVAIFEHRAICFHLTGGLTSVLYGEPRMTQDIDIVIDNSLAAARLEAFIASLAESDFFHDAASIRGAVQWRGMFRMFDNAEALKLGIYARDLIAGELDCGVRAAD